MLQYITDNKSRRSVEEQISEVLGAGCGWIEIDTDGLTDDRIKEIVVNIMPECLKHETFLILRDKVQLAKEINVGGVVLSQGSEFPSHARASLGAAAVIGVEVTTADQIAALKGLDVDYVMLTFSSAAANLDTIRELCSYMEAAEMELPRVACGNVTCDDIPALMEAGCNGVAMSGALSEASDMKAETIRAISLLKKKEG